MKEYLSSNIFEKTRQVLNVANSEKLSIRYKLPYSLTGNYNICVPQSFVMVKDLSQAMRHVHWK